MRHAMRFLNTLFEISLNEKGVLLEAKASFVTKEALLYQLEINRDLLLYVPESRKLEYFFLFTFLSNNTILSSADSPKSN